MSSVPLNRALNVVVPALVSMLLAACGSMVTAPQRVLADGAKWEEVSRAGRLTSEGVVAAKDGMIYVVDFTPVEVLKQNNPGGTIYRYDPNTGTTTKYMEPDGLALGLHVDRNGDLLIAQGAEPGGGRAIVRRNLTSGVTSVVADSYQGKRLVSPNDVTSDAQGRIYFTDARYFGHEPMELPNAVYRVDPDGRITQLSTDILRPNGIEVSPDGRRLYVAATNLAMLAKNPVGPAKDRFGVTMGGVVAYDLDASGNVSNPRLFYRNDDLVVDGMTMDTDGNLYVTMHNGRAQPPRGDIVVLNPAGQLVERIAVPEGMRSNNLGFGRGSDANSLYLTTLFQWRLYRIKTVRHGHYF